MNGTQVDDYRKSVLKRRQGLVSNFVGREKERPGLTTDDLELDSTLHHSENNNNSSKRRQSEVTRVRKRSKKAKEYDTDDDQIIEDEGMSSDEDELLGLESSDMENLTEFVAPEDVTPYENLNFKLSMATPTQVNHMLMFWIMF